MQSLRRGLFWCCRSRGCEWRGCGVGCLPPTPWLPLAWRMTTPHTRPHRGLWRPSVSTCSRTVIGGGADNLYPPGHVVVQKFTCCVQHSLTGDQVQESIVVQQRIRNCTSCSSLHPTAQSSKVATPPLPTQEERRRALTKTSIQQGSKTRGKRQSWGNGEYHGITIHSPHFPDGNWTAKRAKQGQWNMIHGYPAVLLTLRPHMEREVMQSRDGSTG